jgi:hypothetical protein
LLQLFFELPYFLRPAADRAVSILPWVVSRGRSCGFLWADSSIQKNTRKDNPTPAYSPVSDRRRLTALVKVHWARRVQTPMPQISGPNSQENHIIETCKEEGCAVSIQETAARREWEDVQLTRLSAPWTDGRADPQIVDQLAEDSQYNANRGSWIVCGTTWIRRPALTIRGASWTLTLSSTSSTRPQLEEAVLNGLFP